MKKAGRIVLTALVLFVASSYAPQSRALPRGAIQRYFYTGSYCPEIEVGHFLRDCSGVIEEEGSSDGTGAFWKLETLIDCHDGSRQTVLYQKCGAGWVEGACYSLQC